MDQSSLLPHLTLTHDGVLVDLHQIKSLAALKHSGLSLDFFEAAYITPCPYQLAKIQSADVANVLPKLTPFLKEKPSYRLYEGLLISLSAHRQVWHFEGQSDSRCELSESLPSLVL